MANIADTSTYLHSFVDADGNTYVYGDEVAQYTEEQAVKLTPTDSAGLDGRRLGQSFQDLRQIVASGTLMEINDGVNNTPLRTIAQRFRFAHRRGLPGKLYMNSASDSRPAEYLVALVNNLTGFIFEQPLTTTDWEASFLCEPEYWYDELLSQSLHTNATGSGFAVSYSGVVSYSGPDDNFPATATALPLIILSVATIDTSRSSSLIPNNVSITNTTSGQQFTLFFAAAQVVNIDSYQETTTDHTTGAYFEALEHSGYIALSPTLDDGVPVDNAFTVVCDGVTVNAVDIYWIPRHW